MEAYKIWASLNIKGDAIEKMKIFQESIKVANKEISLLNVNLEKFSRNLSLVSPNFEKLAKSFSVINKEGLESAAVFSKYDSALMRSAANTEILSKKTAILTERLKQANLASSGVGVSGRVGKSSGIGLAVPGMIAGYTGYSAISHGFKAYGEYEESALQLSSSGASTSQVQEARNIALYHSPKGVSSIEMMKVLNTAFMASRDWKEAKSLAPMLAETEFGLKATFGNKMSEDQLQNLQKFAEFRAGSDLSKLQSGIDLGAKIVAAGGFTIKPTQLAQFMRRATGMAGTITPEGFAQLEPTIQEVTGTFAGTAIQSQWMNMMLGRVSSKKQARFLEKTGFAHTEYDPHGHPLSTTWDPKLVNLYRTSTVDFIKEIDRRLTKQGIPQSQFSDVYTKAFANTFGRLAAAIEKNMGKSDKELALFNAQLTGTQLYEKSLNIPSGVSERFEAASSRLAVSFGKLTSPIVISGMNLMASLMERLASLFNLLGDKGSFSNQSGNMRTIAKISPVVGSYSNIIHDPLALSRHAEYGNYSKQVIGDPAKMSKEKVTADVYIDNIGKVGRAIFNSISSSMSGSIGGTSGFNGAQSVAPSALANMGTP